MTFNATVEEFRETQGKSTRRQTDDQLQTSRDAHRVEDRNATGSINPQSTPLSQEEMSAFTPY